MKKVLVCFTIVSMLFVCGCVVSGLDGSKRKKIEDFQIKTITVTIDKTTPEDVISILGEPDRRENKVHKEYTETELEYCQYLKGYLFVTTVCNQHNQCASNGRQSRTKFTFRNNKFESIWEWKHDVF